jgi:hypothetical protein
MEKKKRTFIVQSTVGNRFLSTVEGDSTLFYSFFCKMTIFDDSEVKDCR